MLLRASEGYLNSFLRSHYYKPRKAIQAYTRIIYYRSLWDIYFVRGQHVYKSGTLATHEDVKILRMCKGKLYMDEKSMY